MTITNDTKEITIVNGGERRSFTKRNTTIRRNGDWIMIRDYEGSPVEFIYTDVTSPSSANASVLFLTLRGYLNA